MKLLFVKGSPRGEKSTSTQVADSFLAAYRIKHPDAQIDEIDLWQENLPEFDGDKAAAKMSFMQVNLASGVDEPRLFANKP